MNMRPANAARIVAVAALALCASFETGAAAEPGPAGAGFESSPFTITPLPFPKKATFKKWRKSTGSVVVCTGRCGPNGGSLSPYNGTPLNGSPYTAIAISSSAKFVLKTPASAVAFIWGSPDRRCNLAKFYDSTGSLIGKIHVHDLAGAGYYEIQSPTPIKRIEFLERACSGDVYFEIAQGPFPYKDDAKGRPGALPLDPAKGYSP
jgi:hypothetical protein